MCEFFCCHWLATLIFQTFRSGIIFLSELIVSFILRFFLVQQYQMFVDISFKILLILLLSDHSARIPDRSRVWRIERDQNSDIDYTTQSQSIPVSQESQIFLWRKTKRASGSYILCFINKTQNLSLSRKVSHMFLLNSNHLFSTRETLSDFTCKGHCLYSLPI